MIKRVNIINQNLDKKRILFIYHYQLYLEKTC